MTRRRRAVFLDRDGVIVEEVDYLTRVDQLKLLPGAPAAIAALRGAGFKVVVVTNQSAVARGMLTLKGLAAIHRRLKAMLKARGTGLDALYFCPHHPRAGRRVVCRCRKPKTGMLEAAARRFRLDLPGCYLVGDTTTDLMTAKNAGCAGLLVRTGKGGRDGAHRARPRAAFRDLPAAARWILRREAS